MNESGVTIEQMGFDDDHMHMLMIIPPRYSISEVMGQLKAQSASHMRQTFKWLSKEYWKENSPHQAITYSTLSHLVLALR
ncbi:hypothetical protein GCM10011369_31000 [Neiella marina]|uniref:Transposase IS200-like domain-containing protein n=2 Tax=Neiella marina TaxID=508461 RepID=A0A8J2U8H7_9GAMM|nr:hypothetical protein GCM10011369_31000 [Neiella marina]